MTFLSIGRKFNFVKEVIVSFKDYTMSVTDDIVFVKDSVGEMNLEIYLSVRVRWTYT